MATFRARRLFSFFLLENLTSHMIVTKTSLYVEGRIQRPNVLIIEAHSSAGSKQNVSNSSRVFWLGLKFNEVSLAVDVGSVYRGITLCSMWFQGFWGRGWIKVPINKQRK